MATAFLEIHMCASAGFKPSLVMTYMTKTNEITTNGGQLLIKHILVFLTWG